MGGNRTSRILCGAISLLLDVMKHTPVVLHIPHSSVIVPDKLRAKISLTGLELELELLRMTDRYTDELFDVKKTVADRVVFPVSRLVVDPERFEKDADEPMAKMGMGVIYTATSQKGVLRPPPGDVEREWLITKFYRPHHLQLMEQVDARLKQFGRAFIVDCHSFPDKALPYELNQDGDRPDICLGTDGFHSPKYLVDAAEVLFSQRGYSVGIDCPFEGALVPEKHYRLVPRVESIMIELNRKLYMNEMTGEKDSNFDRLAHDVGEIVVCLSDIFQAGVRI